MPPLKNQPSQLQRGKAPDTVGTLRDWVGQDDRIAPTLIELEQNHRSSIGARSTTGEFHGDEARPDHARGTRDEFHRDEARPDQSGSDALASAFENARKFHSSPPLQDLFDRDPYQLPPQAESLENRHPHGPAPVRTAPEHEQPRPSLASRLTRTIVQGMFAVALVGIVLALISDNGIQQRDDSVRAPDVKTSAAQPAIVDQANPLLQQQFALQQQLEKLSNELVTIRRLATTLAAQQEEAAQDLARLQTSQQNIREQVTALTALQSTTQSRRHRRRAAR